MNPLDVAKLGLVAWQCLDECTQRLKGGDSFDGCCVSLCRFFVLGLPTHFIVAYLQMCQRALISGTFGQFCTLPEGRVSVSWLRLQPLQRLGGGTIVKYDRTIVFIVWI